MKRKMSWTPTPSHLMKQMPRKRGPRHKGLESTKWNDEISYLGSEKLMSFWAIFLVLHFASLICGNPLFGCYKGGNIRNYTSVTWMEISRLDVGRINGLQVFLRILGASKNGLLRPMAGGVKILCQPDPE